MKEFGSPYKSTSHRKNNTWCNYTKRLDMYGCGCQHNCDYCYSKSLLVFRGLWDVKNPRVADLYKIGSIIKRLPKDVVIKLGGMTDCFQPIELTDKLTYKTINLLNYHKINYLIVTKSHHVADNDYIEIYNKNLAHFQITITNTDDTKSLEYEKAPVTSKRIGAIEKLYKLGFDVSVRLSPLIEGFIDFDILNAIKCNKILVEFLKANHWVKKWFDIDYSDYMVRYGGHRHLPLYKQLILIKNITGFDQVSVGASVPEHYTYFKENVNYNKQDCCNLRLNKIPKYIQLQLWK